LDEFARRGVAERIERLWALHRSVTSTLVRRGISPASVAEATAALNGVEAVVSARDAVTSTFRPRAALKSVFPVGRFGDGSHAVFYAALDRATCIGK
jgi:hypothetical protein